MDTKLIKIVAVGNASVGKTSLFMTFASNKFPKDYVPPFQDHAIEFSTGKNKNYGLQLWDTLARNESEHALRPLGYPKTNIFLVIYSVVDRQSFQSIAEFWVPEVKQHCRNTPIILVATKTDLRASESTQSDTVITSAEGTVMAHKINASSFIEVSSLNNIGLRELLRTIVKKYEDERETSCCSFL